MRRILTLAALALALAPTTSHADEAHDAVVRNGPYSGTFTAQPPWRPEVMELPGACLGETSRGAVYVRDGTAAPNSFGEFVRCTRDTAQR